MSAFDMGHHFDDLGLHDTAIPDADSLPDLDLHDLDLGTELPDPFSDVAHSADTDALLDSVDDTIHQTTQDYNDIAAQLGIAPDLTPSPLEDADAMYDNVMHADPAQLQTMAIEEQARLADQQIMTSIDKEAADRIAMEQENDAVAKADDLDLDADSAIQEAQNTVQASQELG